MRRNYRVVPMVALLVILGCASTVRIGEIKESPRRFHDQKVTVSGVVDETLTLPILGIGVYRLNDSTGFLWVKPKKDVPFRNDRVTVSGVIKVGISISGKSFGVILIEDDDGSEL
ncbi:MAG: hypothetical protein ACOY90_17110 [Candidatus Zhuqueibacterota bacterium]